MQNKKFQLITRDGLELHGWHWPPPAEVRGAVCLVHGLGEHSGRYAHVAHYLNANGYGVLAVDLRGHGRSEGKRGHTPGYRTLMDDVALLLHEAESRYLGSPHFLYGHSMGGNLVLNFALRRAAPLTGVIASAPMLQMAFEPPCWKMLLGKILHPFWPVMTVVNGIRAEDLSRDPEVVRAYREDPLVHDRVTLAFLDIREAGLWALDHAAELTLPALLMHGDADRITSPEASRAFAAAAGGTCMVRLWDGFYHEIHNEPGKERVFGYLSQWLEDTSRGK